jgi:hypothetical protein
VLLIIYGPHGLQIFTAQHLAGKHNKHLQDKLLLFSDEAVWGGDREAERILKGIVTERAMFIEPKGVDGFQWPNRLSLYISANPGWVVPASCDERRYAVNNVSEKWKQNKEYFRPLFAQVNGDGPAAMLYDLLRMDLADWHPRENVPQTRALLEQKMESLNGLEQWYLGLLNTGELPYAEKNNPRLVRSSYLFDDAKQLLKNRYINETNLGLFLGDMGCENHHNAKFRGWIFPPLPEARQRWNTRIGGEWNWLTPNLADWGVAAGIMDKLI